MDRYNSDTHCRRSIRLPGYDYSRAGAYFVTICAHEQECLFGDIVEGEMRLNYFGRIVMAEWIRAGELRAEVKTGEYVVMPNHFHGIVMITEDMAPSVGMCDGVGAIHELPLRSRQQRRKMALPKIVGRFKMISAKRINIHRDTPGVSVWQRNYYEHVIRDDADYARIAEYIADNPRRWMEDTLHMENYSGPAHTNRCGNATIGGNGNMGGAIHELPLRNVPPAGGCHE